MVIRRIFIGEPPTLVTNTELSRILAMQRSAGVEVRLLDGGEAAQNGALSDYVIFDEQICYDTTPEMRREAPGTPWRLTTRLVLDEETIRHRVEHFRELWTNALPVGLAHVGEDGPAVVSNAEPFGPA